MRKNNALFVISSALGHLNRAIQFAKQLNEEQGCICYFVVEEKYRKIIIDNGFLPIITNSSPFGIGIENVIFKKTFSGYLDNLISRLTNNLFFERKKDYIVWIKKVKPSFIFLDYQFEPDVVVINTIPDSSICKLFIFQTVFSTKIKWGYPAVFSKYIPGQINLINFENLIFILKRIIGYAFSYIKYLTYDDVSLVLKNQSKVLFDIKIKKNFLYYSKFYTNIPRLIMLPVELEYDTHPKDLNCEYMGFYINKNDEHLNNIDFYSVRELIKKFKKTIFVSLGTLHLIHTKGRSKYFFDKICEVSKEYEEYFFIISFGGEKFDLYNANYPNVRIFNFINQFKILKEVDLFITHGGMNSILESIYQECPMLVFPLNNYFDQCGNASRVQYHKIGYSLNFSDGVSEIKKMIDLVFENYAMLKTNIQNIKLKINYQRRFKDKEKKVWENS